MMEAHIVSPRGSLYYAGDSHPYDLELLWEHVRDAGSDANGRDIHLELILDDALIEPGLSAWVHKIAAIGVQVQLLFSRTPAPA
jgi:hypothetical protein